MFEFRVTCEKQLKYKYSILSRNSNKKNPPLPEKGESSMFRLKIPLYPTARLSVKEGTS